MKKITETTIIFCFLPLWLGGGTGIIIQTSIQKSWFSYANYIMRLALSDPPLQVSSVVFLGVSMEGLGAWALEDYFMSTKPMRKHAPKGAGAHEANNGQEVCEDGAEYLFARSTFNACEGWSLVRVERYSNCNQIVVARAEPITRRASCRA